VVFGLVLGSLAAPIYTKLFMGATVEVDMLHMFQQIALFVFLPLFAGLVTQVAVKKRFGEAAWRQSIQPKFPPFSALGVIMIAFLAMALKAKTIIAHPGDILIIMGPLAFFYVVSYVLLSLTGRLFFARGDAVAMVFGVVMRDLSIALAIAMTAFGKEGATIALLIALAYVIQIQSAAWYVRLVDKVFGKEKKTSEAGPPAEVDAAAAKVTRLPESFPVQPEGMVPTLRRILYATDLSETARHAVRYACSLGNRYGAEVTVLHVIPDIIEEFSKEAGIDLAEHMDKKEWESFNALGIQKAKAAIARRLDETSRQVKKEIPECPIIAENAQVLVGNPVEQILSAAIEGAYDLVIMGTHGHGGIEQAVIGSVAGEVIRKCPVPVMVIRLPKDKQPAQEDSEIRSENATNSLPPTSDSEEQRASA
jgi:ACR3 family arsenite transporter